MQHGNRHFGQHTADDGRLAERAVTGLAQRDEDTLEEGCGFEEGLLDCHVQMIVEDLVHPELVADAREEHEVVKPRMIRFNCFFS